VGVTLLYVLTFVILRVLFGFGATPLAIVPVAVAGQLHGLRGGLIAGLLLILLNLSLLALAGQSSEEMGAMLLQGGWAGLASLVIVGPAVGWLSDLPEHMGRELAERRRIEDALQRERDFAESLIETAQALVLVLDPEGRIVRLNPYLEEISGYSLEEVQGNDWVTTFLPERDREPVRELLSSALGGVQTRGNVNAIVTKDGRELLTEWYDRTLKDTEGNVVGLLSIGQDITQRRQVEEALRASEERYRGLFERMPIGLYRVSPDGQILDVNSALVDMLGYPDRQALMNTHTIESYANPEDQDRWQALLEQEGIVTGFEVQWKRQDGTLLWVRENTRSVYDDTGRVLHYEGAVEDISERVEIETIRAEAEQALRDYSARLEEEVKERTVEMRTQYAQLDAIFRSVGDGIVMSDLDRKVQYVNDAFTTLTGYTFEEVMEQTADFLATEKPPVHIVQARRAAMERGEIWRGEVSIRRKDGRVYDAELSIAPMHDADGRLMGHVSSYRDISQRRNLERARTQFITNVSHQLRTPVTTIQLYVHLLQEQELSEKARGFFENIKQELYRLTGLVEDIMTMATLESGKVLDTWRPVPIAAVVGSIIDLYQEQARASELTLEIAPQLPEHLVVNGDQARLAQALGELLENAITFTPLGGQVTLEAEETTENGSTWITLTVRDTGPGIPDEEQDKVFDRFFRGSIVAAGTIPGTGLGLSIAQEIVRAHGGRVTMESEEGKGSTFVIWLPLAEGDEAR
jgi:two-component system cell cycle sensor histidine kinase/response regulator CckA